MSNIKKKRYSIRSYHTWEGTIRPSLGVVPLYIWNISESVQSLLGTVNIWTFFKPHRTLLQEAGEGWSTVFLAAHVIIALQGETGQMLDLCMRSTSEP